MASFSQSASSSFGNPADAAFNSADINRDGRVDLNEFRSFIGKPIFFQSLCFVSINNNCC
jgi:hypothetical protein